MKKKIVAVMCCIPGLTFAADYTLINHSNKASPATVFAQSYANAVKKNADVEFYQAQNCEEATTKFNKTSSAVMIYNADVGIAAMSKNLACGVHKIEAQNLVYSGSSYFKVCRAKDQQKKLADGRVTFGMASVVLSKGIIADYNSNGLNLVGVPFGGSKNVLAAVVAKDIDYGFIGASIAQPAIDAGQIECVLSTDPRDSNYQGKVLKMKIPDFKLWKAIYTNEKDVAKVEALRKAARDDEFEAFLKKNNQTTKTSGFKPSDVSDFTAWIDYNYNLYWK